MSTEPQPDLFNTSLMFKAGGTSAAAAASAAETARLNDLHRVIWRMLRDNPRTPDELVGLVKGSKGRTKDKPIVLNSIRARISELKSRGWLEPTGETRQTAAGLYADVMKAVTRETEFGEWRPDLFNAEPPENVVAVDFRPKVRP